MHDQPDQATVVPLTDEPEQTPARYRRPWAQLLARVFDRQVLVCPRCQGPSEAGVADSGVVDCFAR